MEPYLLKETEEYIFFYKPPFYIMDTSINYSSIKDKTEILQQNNKKPFLLFIEKYLKNHYDTTTTYKKQYNCCQRLDIQTSGIIMIAKYNKYFPICREIINDKANTIKLYMCLTNGLLFYKKGYIIKKIDCGENPIYCRFYNKDYYKGKTIVSYYQVLAEYRHENRYYSLINVRIFTGRTHQIRVSMNSQNTPIVSDNLYYLNKDIKKENKKLINRMFLHNYNLVIKNSNNKEINVFCDLPEDLKDCLKKLEIIKKYKYNNLYDIKYI